ncbi:MAG TPA: NAD(P)H-quinone oxidoreductase [Gammaproteobacteria bacterium]|nr:NAD(P)H-quinone oxidoreductase [Gammaproteobacteria bacterium]
MPAVVAREAGDVDVLECCQFPLPVPAAGEVLIRVRAAGVNRADVLQRQGRYPIPTGGTPILGLEVAGEIVALGGGVSGWSLGDRVCTLTNGGAYAGYAVAPAVQLLPWPRGYDAVPAACLPESCFTVWANVFQAGRLRAGETALIQGGRGGVGTMAIELARAFGARVLATSGSDEGCRDCLGLGAQHAINYHREDFVAAVMAATEEHGVDVVLDHVGASSLERNLAVLAPDGRLVLIGVTGGHVAEHVDLLPFLARRLVLTGSAMRPRSAAEKGAIAAELLAKVWPLLNEGRCRPQVAHMFPLEKVAEAHRLMEEGGYLGKIVLTVPD